MLPIACEKQPDTIPVTGIVLSQTSVELTEGESVTITATVSPGDATNKKVIWSSDHPSILVSDGKITTSFQPGAATTTLNGRQVLGQGTVTATSDDGG
ncbi:MAG: Ig-like domain-containing protein, partial [Bacteroidales bacterium]|nr:Ig-like domain-containing protein [Bacteroidales bacterium]